MNPLQIEIKESTRIAVIGDIHACPEQFNNLREKIPEDCFIVSLGDLFDKGFGQNASMQIVQQLRALESQGRGNLILGNHEIKFLKNARRQFLTSPDITWLERRSPVLSFVWPNGRRLTCVHAGICPVDTWDNILRSETVYYVRRVDSDGHHIPLVWKKLPEGGREGFFPKPGINWHECYDGRFGFVAAGHAAQKDGQAKFYTHSCNLDSAVYETGILTCQIFNYQGLDTLLTVQGPIPPRNGKT